MTMEGELSSKEPTNGPIRTPASRMSIFSEDMPLVWEHERSKVMGQPNFGQRDYAASNFKLVNAGQQKATISFETVVYKDAANAMSMFGTMVSKLGPLSLSKLDVGDIGVMIQTNDRPSKRFKAISFVQNNVIGIIMASSSDDRQIPDVWLVKLARLMSSRFT